MRLGIISTDPDVAVLGAGKDQTPYKYEKDQKLYSPAAASAHLIEQSGQYLISLVREGRYQPDENNECSCSRKKTPFRSFPCTFDF